MGGLSADETGLAQEILNQMTCKNVLEKSFICVEDTTKLFQITQLPNQVLSYILSLADENGTGYLEQERLGVAIRLVGWAQAGIDLTRAYIHRRAISCFV
jgi:hypothetical protein